MSETKQANNERINNMKREISNNNCSIVRTERFVSTRHDYVYVKHTFNVTSRKFHCFIFTNTRIIHAIYVKVQVSENEKTRARD